MMPPVPWTLEFVGCLDLGDCMVAQVQVTSRVRYPTLPGGQEPGKCPLGKFPQRRGRYLR
jgi:hypothetical protein